MEASSVSFGDETCDKGSGRKEVHCVVRRAGSQRSIFREQRILGVGTVSSGDVL